jgi:hypothetical protein
MDVLTYCAQKRNRIWTEINNVEFILANRGQFSDEPDTDDWSPLTTYLESLREDLDVVTKAASHALDHPSDAAMPTLAAVAPTLPKRKEGVLNPAAESGAAAVSADPVARALRDTLQSAAAVEGFNVGMDKERQFTLWGPGQQQFKDSLDEQAQRGYQLAADHCLNRNNNPERAVKGQAVVLADPDALAARAALPVTQWLGFNIASAIFGDPALGAQGNTLMGPGSQKVRDSLIADGPAGFDRAVQHHMAKKYV